VTKLKFVQGLPIVISRHDARIVHCAAGSIVVDISTILGTHGNDHEHRWTRKHLPTHSGRLVIAIDSFDCDLYSQNAITKNERIADLNVTLLPLIARELQKTKVGAIRNL